MVERSEVRINFLNRTSLFAQERQLDVDRVLFLNDQAGIVNQIIDSLLDHTSRRIFNGNNASSGFIFLNVIKNFRDSIPGYQLRLAGNLRSNDVGKTSGLAEEDEFSVGHSDGGNTESV